jgi:hypothetical protein
MHNGRPSFEKKPFYPVQRGRAQLLKKPQAEALCDRGIHSIKDGVRSRALYPRRPAPGEQTSAGFGKLEARLALGPLQPPGKIKIRKYHRTVHRTQLKLVPQYICPKANTYFRFRTFPS